MKKIVILIAIIFTGLSSWSQVTISGTIKDKKGRPLPGTAITLKGTYDGTIADSTGFFSFKTTEKGNFTLIINSMGYSYFEQEIILDKDPIIINAVLKEQLDELKAVTVTAGAFEAGDKKRAATVLTSIDIATTGGANADISSALKTLPGAQQVGESEGLFVRGGAAYETKQFIDGTVVNNPFFTSVPDIATRGRFSPFLFKGTVFTTGGYSALYGQALSSALILESIDLPERTSANASISPILLGAGIQTLSKNKKSSWGVNYNHTNLLVYFNIVKQTPDYFKMPAFHSGDANFRIKTKSGGIIKYYTTISQGQLGLRRPDIDSAILKNAFGINNFNWYNNLSWRENLGKGWKMNLGMGYSTNHDKITNELQDANNTPVSLSGLPWIIKNYKLKSRQDLSQVRGVFEKRLFGISTIRFGSEYWHACNSSGYNGYDTVLKDNYAAVFAETDIYVTNDIALKAGGRYEYSSIIKKANIAPRLSLAYKTGPGAQVSVAYGEFYQKPENQQLILSNRLGYTKATHYIANYQKTTNERIFRAEVFYKKYKDLVKTYPAFNNDGTGYAKGIEFFWRDKKTIRNFDYWISYSYLDTKRDYLNYPGQLQPNFAAKHTASLVTKRFVTEWKTGFNFTYTFATGRPYYNLQTDANGKVNIADQGKTRSYNNLGFSVNYLPNLGKQNARTFIVLVASITNVLGAKPVFGYNYSYNGLNKEPVGLPAPRFYFIGCFLSWGIDRSQDAINNNL